MVDVNVESETDMTILLVNYFFGKLVILLDFIIYKGCKSERGKRCSCSDGNCVLIGDFGDISIGI